MRRVRVKFSLRAYRAFMAEERAKGRDYKQLAALGAPQDLPPLSDELRADLMRRITHFANRAETVEDLVMALHPEREPPFYGACELIGG